MRARVGRCEVDDRVSEREPRGQKEPLSPGDSRPSASGESPRDGVVTERPASGPRPSSGRIPAPRASSSSLAETVSSSEQPDHPYVLATGDSIADKYRIESVLGEGGMCVVYGARRLHFEDRVAIKVLRVEMAGQAAMVQRFVLEGKASSRIRSHHVVRVIDVGTLPAGLPYLVLEYLEGSDLDAHLAAAGPLPFATAVDYVLQACEAIAEAHALGIVHRDLKPANLFLTTTADGSPWIKVFDFGISKVAPEGDRGKALELTDPTSIIGSPQYMSPEQLRAARDVDPRSDIWSLGAILFELMTGRTPFAGKTVPEICASILREEPDAIRNHRPDCPIGLERTILRCLQKDKSFRFHDVRELARALAPFASDIGLVSVRRITGTSDIGASLGAASPNATGRLSLEPVSKRSSALDEEAPRRSARTKVLAGGALLLLLLLATGLFAVRRDRSSARAARPTEQAPEIASPSRPPSPVPPVPPPVEASAAAEGERPPEPAPSASAASASGPRAKRAEAPASSAARGANARPLEASGTTAAPGEAPVPSKPEAPKPPSPLDLDSEFGHRK